MSVIDNLIEEIQYGTQLRDGYRGIARIRLRL